jgi:16S rRNA (uracil1498-N3)-methyltransferase
MECLYILELNENSDEIVLNDSESKHTKSLRLGLGEEIMVTNGEGLSAKCILLSISKQGNTLKCIDFFKNTNEIECEITVAVGILENQDRFEYIIEKSVELGAKVIVPLATKYSSQKPVRYERAEAKIIAALKQSKRSVLPQYSQPVHISQIYDRFDLWDYVVLADENGSKTIDFKKAEKVLILCGPEGGFSDEELIHINKATNLNRIKLANSRLRSETAAISALANVVFHLD